MPTKQHFLRPLTWTWTAFALAFLAGATAVLFGASRITYAVMFITGLTSAYALIKTFMAIAADRREQGAPRA